MKLGNSGSTLIVTTISFVAILGFAALVIDIGITLLERQKLSNAVDAAALAGMQEITNTEERVIEMAEQYAETNGANSDSVNVVISYDKKSVGVETSKDVKYYFAKILGINEKKVGSSAKVKVAPITSYRGVRPLVVPDQVFEYNKQYILKEDSGDGLSGNYGVVALGGNGSSIYENNLTGGYVGLLRVGDSVITQTGNITQSTRRGVQTLIDGDPYSDHLSYSKDSSRLIIIPVVNTLDLNGKKPIYVVGFAAFFIEGLRNSGGNTEIVGRFVKLVAEGDSSEYQNDYGLKGLKLIE